MTVTGIYLFSIYHNYFMWHRSAAFYLDSTSQEEQARIAKANKRNFGFNLRYKPQLEISKKREMYEELGGK